MRFLCNIYYSPTVTVEHTCVLEGNAVAVLPHVLISQYYTNKIEVWQHNEKPSSSCTDNQVKTSPVLPCSA